MKASVSRGSSHAAPLTAKERKRIGTLLAAVSTRTLLHSLETLSNDSEDARLIIAALLDRFPTS